MTPFLSNSLKALVTGTVTNGFPSVTSVLQHLVFKMTFHDVLFTAPSPSPGGDEKVILIFQRSPVNYSTALCIAYSLQVTFFIKMRKLCSILTILRAFARKLVQDYIVLVCFTLFLFPSIYIFFNTLKIWCNSSLNKFICTISPTAFAHFMSLYHILFILTIF